MSNLLRNLDELIAEFVMGVPKPPESEAPGRHSSRLTHKSNVWYWSWQESDPGWHAYPFSSDMKTAWAAVEKFTRPILGAKDGEFWLDGLGFRCCERDEDGTHGRWRCSLTTERDGERITVLATDDSAPRAICLALMHALPTQPAEAK